MSVLKEKKRKSDETGPIAFYDRVGACMLGSGDVNPKMASSVIIAVHHLMTSEDGTEFDSIFLYLYLYMYSLNNYTNLLVNLSCGV